MTTSHPAALLLEALFSHAPCHLYLEVRPLHHRIGASSDGRIKYRQGNTFRLFGSRPEGISPCAGASVAHAGVGG